MAGTIPEFARSLKFGCGRFHSRLMLALDDSVRVCHHVNLQKTERRQTCPCDYLAKLKALTRRLDWLPG